MGKKSAERRGNHENKTQKKETGLQVHPQNKMSFPSCEDN